MKKILSLAVLLAFSLAMYAQKDVTKFLGIPVDGTKSEMIKKLKEKGFTESSNGDDILEGEFNGTDVYVSIVTDNNKVWRIGLADRNMTNETNIRIRFNNLCQQFKNNKNYMPFSTDYTIPDDEKIGYEILVNKKRYEANFYQCPDTTLFIQTIAQKYANKQSADSLTEEQKEKILSDITSYVAKLTLKKSVWFIISEIYGQYYITMFYDNEYNHAQGEDL